MYSFGMGIRREQIRAAAAFHAAHGTGRMLASLVTAPEDDSDEVAEWFSTDSDPSPDSPTPTMSPVLKMLTKWPTRTPTPAPPPKPS